MITDRHLIEVSLLRDKVESFNEYPFCLDAVKHLESFKMHPSVTFIIGEKCAYGLRALEFQLYVINNYK
ncbi:hypothetical protein GF312_05255 [Candidatus Poribacteria bacterium]|nr:hypothetical protein [Candidatus Poribacteria bacterium]